MNFTRNFGTNTTNEIELESAGVGRNLIQRHTNARSEYLKVNVRIASLLRECTIKFVARKIL